ncbi:MAG: zinc ribbon domain-containing protein [Thermoplasmata archaeon]|nr:zinc ribbon domain-containing protein [Thermoplasmata archaeon]
MAALDSAYLVVIAGLLVALTFLGFLFALRRLRKRRATLAKELSDSPALLPDRAFNAIAIARSEASVLTREGFDVQRQVERLNEAQGLSDRHDYLAAVALARSVHDTMVQIRRTGVVPATASGSGGATPSAAATRSARAGGPSSEGFRPELLPTELGPEPADDATDPDVPASMRLPKNRVESQFELELLTDELGRTPPTNTALGEATALRTQASAAFGQSDYTEALRLALRGRRRLGSKVDGLASPASPGARSTGPAAATGPLTPRCSACGQELRPDDVFCRACGAPRPGGNCPRCGAAFEGADQFCGRCGAPRG